VPPFRWRVLWLLGGNEEKTVAVMETKMYLDESGIHRGASVCVIAGLVGTRAGWDQQHLGKQR
jgi:hypothetical protein